MSQATWVVQTTTNARFPYRIRIEQGGRDTLVLRAQERWPGPGGQVFCLREPADADLEDVGEEVERVPVAAINRLGRKLGLTLDRATRKRCDFLFITRPYKNRPGEYEQIFFRTQSGLTAHRTRGRVQLFGNTPLTVVIDSGERYAWKFPGAEVRRARLPAGDYALSHEERLVAVVERKSLQNLLGDIGQVQVLHQKLGELGTYPHAAVVVEALYGDFLVPEKVGRWPVTHVARVLAELAALHATVPLVYAGNRKLAAEWTHGFFSAVAASLGDPAPDLLLEVAAPYNTPASGGHEHAVRHAVLHQMPSRFAMTLLRQRFPQVPAQRLRNILGRLRDEGRLHTEGRGPATRWVRTGADEPGTGQAPPDLDR